MNDEIDGADKVMVEDETMEFAEIEGVLILEMIYAILNKLCQNIARKKH